MRLLSRKIIPARSSRLPDGVRVYAVGDIHGRVDLLDDILARIDSDLAQHPCEQALQIFLGDYIDRGPASRDVIDRLIERRRSHRAVCLKGNHDGLLAAFLKDPSILPNWRAMGGIETLMSYGLKPAIRGGADDGALLAEALRDALPQAHLAYLASLEPFFNCGDYFFVHAGVRPGISLTRQTEEDLLWIREDFLRCDEDFEKIVVHGHTPVKEPDVRRNRINIDTGAYITGRLTCLRMEQDKFHPL